MLKCHDADASISHSPRPWDVAEQQVYLLKVQGEGDMPTRELEVRATNVTAAIERAVIVFGRSRNTQRRRKRLSTENPKGSVLVASAALSALAICL